MNAAGCGRGMSTDLQVRCINYMKVIINNIERH